MIHCNSRVCPPWFETAQAHQQAGSPVLPHSLVCELAQGHSDEHAGHLEDMGRGTFDVWVRWNGDEFTYVCAAPCEMVDPTLSPHRQQACMLFVDHAPGHSWEFEDLLHD
ncbi:hypothetical protein OG892_10700 [Streptomyces sp. NBC_00341]|uniref:hypothetical protein n=1 Tax=unclassified Streptomyces TaxID=2593676 RepID=UPI0009654BA9|nr:hypothetical protein [Streptomyces sp. CB02488]OKK18742.1 hypothetical protein AMK09_17600 [Streptomyces sp. CB02488]WRZ11219.1 hypothetical protein OG892_10700 [Streptomyces sp. NBC_00341]